MAISGRLAQSARLGLEEMVKQKLLEDQLAQKATQQQFENTLRLKDFDADQDYRAQALEAQDRTRRDANNARGIAEQNDQAVLIDKQQAVQRRNKYITDLKADPNANPALARMLEAEDAGVKGGAVKDFESPAERKTREMGELTRVEAESAARARGAAPFRKTGGGGGDSVDPNGMSADAARKLNQERQLRKEWDTKTAPAQEMARQFRYMRDGIAQAERGDMASGAQAVLVTFQKILDPTSVVRESEYARSAAGQAVLAQVRGAFERLSQGGAGVPIAELKKFADLARKFTEGAIASTQDFTRQQRKTAERYGIDPDAVTRDLSGLLADDTAPAAQEGGGTPRTDPYAAYLAGKKKGGR